MKVFTRLCLLAVMVIAAGSPAFAQATIHGDLTKDWAGQKALLVGLANAMPEDKYGFKPTPAQRSFGEHVLHIAQVNVMLTKALGGKTPEPAIDMKATTKAEMIKAMSDAFDYGAAVIAEFNNTTHPGDDSGAVHGPLDPGARDVLPERPHPGHVRPDGGVSAPQRSHAAGQRAPAVVVDAGPRLDGGGWLRLSFGRPQPGEFVGRAAGHMLHGHAEDA